MTLQPIAPRARVIVPSTPEGQRRLKELQARKDQPEEQVSDRPAVAELAGIRRALCVVRAACSLVEEGTVRATATLVAERAERFGLFIDPWEVGQIASQCQIPTRASHGKSRFALDFDELTGLRDRLAEEADDLAPRFDEEIARFDGLAERVEQMRERVRTVSLLQAEARSLKEFIEKTKGIGRIVENYREQAAGLKQQAETADKYGPYIAQLEEKAKALPKLKKRADDLKQRVADAEAQSKALDEQERSIARTEAGNAHRATALGRKADDVQRRTATLDLAELEQQTADAKKELDSVLKQLGEKKGLLSRMLGGGS